MRVMILGGDGFCGWPASLHLSQRGHDVIIVDNLARRASDRELGVESLTPIRPLEERLRAWKAVSGRRIDFHLLDIAHDFEALVEVMREEGPEAIVHAAGQRASPDSIRSTWHRRYTVDNNVNATHTVLCAMAEASPDVHLVHLGSLGVYGYGRFRGLPLPQGYISATLRSGNVEAAAEFLFPPEPVGICHLTEAQGTLLFQFYARSDRLRITDLRQGIVWGVDTDQTRLDERLVNRFDYDGDHATVLNRFLAQAAMGLPLTVHGSGRQTRAFIHLADMVRCIEWALETPPPRGERMRILNQLTETHRVIDLAHRIADATGAAVVARDNPHGGEAADNDLAVANDTLGHLGGQPLRLSERLMEEVIDTVCRWSDRCDHARLADSGSRSLPFPP
ncbi:MAG TPA: NAD-dependent epimerase/dehydratase family protein [Azospirillaceae bacterium]|nr:NAD-dependent epimerase/dehydratase family protein [Azospirillaceae bacterium]